MTAQPHPFRCETCAHFQTSGKGMSPDCDQISHWLTEGDRKLIIEVGCASHSASSQQRIEQAQVDAILNPLIAKFMVSNEKGQWRPWNIGHISDTIEEYRKDALALLRGEQR